MTFDRFHAPSASMPATTPTSRELAARCVAEYRRAEKNNNTPLRTERKAKKYRGVPNTPEAEVASVNQAINRQRLCGFPLTLVAIRNRAKVRGARVKEIMEAAGIPIAPPTGYEKCGRPRTINYEQLIIDASAKLRAANLPVSPSRIRKIGGGDLGAITRMMTKMGVYQPARSHDAKAQTGPKPVCEHGQE